MARTSVPPPQGPAFGWPGSTAVGLVGYVAGWLITDSVGLAVVGGVTAALVWYGVHRLVAALSAGE